MRPAIVIAGRLVADPEAGKGAKPMARFRVASDFYNFSTKAREAEFWGCVVFGREAETLMKIGTKGGWVTVVGEAGQNEWTGKDGVAHKDIQVVANHIDYGPKAQGGVASAPVPWQAEAGRVDGPADDPFSF